MAEVLATFAIDKIENGLNITRQAMKKTKIKFLIITVAAFSVIFFFASKVLAAGCCKYQMSTSIGQAINCNDDVPDDQSCQSICSSPLAENCIFEDGKSCFDVSECPQRGCCRCIEGTNMSETGTYKSWSYKCFDNETESQCKDRNRAITGWTRMCSLLPGQKCYTIPDCRLPPPPTPPPKYQYEPVYPSLQIPIPGIPSLTEFAKVEIRGEPGERYIYIPWIGQYIAAIYGWAMGVVGILAVVMIIWGGVIYLTAGGSPERISTAKSYITSAITGLVLAFGSYLLLYTINPDLVKFAAMKIRVIEREEFLLIEEDIGKQERPNLVSIEGIDNIVLAPSVEMKELRSETKEALKRAAEILKNRKFENEPIVLQINDAARSYEKQLDLYNKYGKGRACFPRENEYNCPHIAGIAVDVVCQGKSSKSPCQKEVKKAMYEAGFCRYEPEAWHFEFPKMSKSCITEIIE